jgi:hypothetical protein
MPPQEDSSEPSAAQPESESREETLQRLIDAALQGGLSLDPRSVDPAVLELPARLRGHG